MSDRTWKILHKIYNPDYREYVKRHRPTRAPWWARLLGIFSPNFPKRIYAERLRRFKVAAKARYKLRCHEAKADPKGFEEKYNPKPPLIDGGGMTSTPATEARE